MVLNEGFHLFFGEFGVPLHYHVHHSFTPKIRAISYRSPPRGRNDPRRTSAPRTQTAPPYRKADGHRCTYYQPNRHPNDKCTGSSARSSRTLGTGDLFSQQPEALGQPQKRRTATVP